MGKISNTAAKVSNHLPEGLQSGQWERKCPDCNAALKKARRAVEPVVCACGWKWR